MNFLLFYINIYMKFDSTKIAVTVEVSCKTPCIKHNNCHHFQKAFSNKYFLHTLYYYITLRVFCHIF